MKSRSYLVFLCLLLVLQPTFHLLAQNPKPKSPSSAKLQEFNPRNGLSHFYRKVKAGQEVRMAYLGGSITEAESGWRDLSFNALRVQFPTTPFRQINAGIGGTGSDLGVFRLQDDVLNHGPDLLLVEFAVNDANRAPAAIYRSMEGIVRKTWKANPATDILFVYTLTQKLADTLRLGQFPRAAQAMERVAEHYGIPSLHLGVEVARLEQAGKLVFTGKPEEHPGKIVFSNDGVHPYPASGHPIYAHVLLKHLARLEAGAASRPHRLPQPLVPDNWEEAQMVPLARFLVNRDVPALPPDHELAGKFSKDMPLIYKAVAPGEVLRVRFKGTMIGAYDIMGPGAGIVEALVNGQPPQEISRFDAYCTWYRKNSFLLPPLPDQEHTVTFRVTDKAPDKAAILSQRKQVMEDPDRYRENAWLVSKLLIIGHILEE